MKIQHVLMCPPTYFDIEYSINPYMDVRNRVDKRKAQEQWELAYQKLRELEVTIDVIDPVPGLPDMTFTGDCGMVYGKKFIASRFRHVERAGEVAPYVSWLREHGYEIHVLPDNIFFEGLGDVIYYDDDIIFGFGPRSSPEAIDHVKRIFPELHVLGELHLKDTSFYHTALAIALIDKDTVLYYSDAFMEESRHFIQQHFERAIAIGEQDAREFFVCNNIPIGKKILLDNCTEDLRKALERWDYEVVKCDMSEFKKSGGSIRCLILNL